MYAFPDFDDNLRQSAITETELLFETIVREDRPLTELCADYTFLNERLAKHYGVPNSTAISSAALPSPTTGAAACSGTQVS